jgi:hypothetical protein
MSPNVLLEIAELHDKTVSQLVQRYEQVFEEECRSRNKQYLIRRIAWRLQANDEGGLSRAALQKAEEFDKTGDRPRVGVGANASIFFGGNRRNRARFHSS